MAEPIIIYSDGTCKGNPGPGGWAVVIRRGKALDTHHGSEANTTNNRMELTAAIRGLQLLEPNSEVDFHTDSQYVSKGISQWIHAWKRNNWQTSAKTPVKNADLWRALDAEVSRHRIRWHWVKGHAGVPDNELADQLANRAVEALRT